MSLITFSIPSGHCHHAHASAIDAHLNIWVVLELIYQYLKLIPKYKSIATKLNLTRTQDRIENRKLKFPLKKNQFNIS